MKLTMVAISILSVLPIFCSGAGASEKADTEILCRAIKENNFFKSFSLRLRNTDNGLKLVENSVTAYPEFSEIETLELRPQINVTTKQKPIPGFRDRHMVVKRIIILSGDAQVNRSAALEINIDPIQGNTGRLQSWWPGQTSSLTARLLCFKREVYSNSQPVIP